MLTYACLHLFQYPRCLDGSPISIGDTTRATLSRLQSRKYTFPSTYIKNSNTFCIFFANDTSYMVLKGKTPLKVAEEVKISDEKYKLICLIAHFAVIPPNDLIAPNAHLPLVIHAPSPRGARLVPT